MSELHILPTPLWNRTMINRPVVTLGLASLLLMSISASVGRGEEVPDKEEADAAAMETIVYPARRAEVADLAKALGEVFEESALRIESQEGGRLVMRVRAAERDEVLRLLDRLDRPARAIFVQVVLLKAGAKGPTDEDLASLSGPAEVVFQNITAMETSGRGFAARKLELTVEEAVPTTLHVGERVSMVTGESRTSTGITSQVASRNVGTLILLTAGAAGDDAIKMQLKFGSSSIHAEEREEGESPASPQFHTIATISHEAAVQLSSGHARLVGGMMDDSAGKGRQAWLVVAARLLLPGEKRSVTISVASQDDAPPARRGFSGNSGFSGGRFSPQARPTAIIRAAFSRYDTNDDGVLTREEWVQSGTDPSSADADGDGRITEQEYIDWRSGPRGASPLGASIRRAPDRSERGG